MLEKDVYGGLEENGKDDQLGDRNAGHCSRHCSWRVLGSDGDKFLIGEVNWLFEVPR